MKSKRTVDSEGLTMQERLFVTEYVLAHGKNGGQAARKAGYTGDVAKRAWELLQRERIQAAIKNDVERFLERFKIKKDSVLTEVAKIAFFDPRRLFSSDDKLRPMSELDPVTASAIAGIDCRAGGVIKIKFSSKLAALELLGRFLHLWDAESREGSKDRLDEVIAAMRGGPVPKKEVIQ